MTAIAAWQRPAVAENASAGVVWSPRRTADGLTMGRATCFAPVDLGAPVTKAEFGRYPC